MEQLETMLQNLESEIETKNSNIKEKMSEDLGTEEDLVREVAKQGYPGDTAKNMKNLQMLGNERKALKAVKKAIEDINTGELEEKIKEIKEERQKTDRKGSEQIMYGYSAAVQSLEEAKKLVKEEEYHAEGLGKSAATTFPDPQKKIEKQLGLENKFLKDFREKNVHLFLRSSKTLGEATKTHDLEEQGLKNVKTLREKLRKKLRETAEDLDYLIANAAAQLEKTRKQKEKLESPE